MPSEDRLPWILRLVYDWPYALDLTDENGEPDHDKMLPALTAIASMVFLFVNPTPSWEAMVFLVVVGAYVYGFSAWREVAAAVSARIMRGPLPNAPINVENAQVQVDTHDVNVGK